MSTFDYQKALDLGYSPSEIDNFLGGKTDIQVLNKPNTTQPASLPPITPKVIQTFNNYNPSVERFSPGGKNIGVDLEANTGTDLYTPQGNWKVVETYNTAKYQGRLGNNENRGYGNSVLIQNTDTGEKLRMSHLSQVATKPGQIVKGGTLVAKSGWTGNATGPHLDLEYYDKSGKLADATKTPYAENVFKPTTGQ